MIEVIITIMMTTILLGMAVGLVHVLMKVDRTGRARLTDRAAVAHLAQLFRSDVRAAVDLSAGEAAKKADGAVKDAEAANKTEAAPTPKTAATTKNPNAIVASTLGRRLGLLALPGLREVEYRLHEDQLIRIVRQADEIRHQDTFRLPRGATARINFDSREQPAVVALILESTPGVRSEGGLREYRVESILGRDHRYEARRD
jgi:hypothetical protein